MNNFKNLTSAELNALIEQAKKELKRRSKVVVKKTVLYKKKLPQAKNISLKIARTIDNTQPEMWMDKENISKVKMHYKLTNLSQKKGSILNKIIKGYQKDVNKFEQNWKKHYEKASNAIDFLYDNERAKVLKKKLRTEIKKKALAQYLINIAELNLSKSPEGHYARLFDAVIKDTYPNETNTLIQRLVQGGYSETEIRKLKDEYQQSGEYGTPQNINYRKVFEKSLTQAVEDFAPNNKLDFLGSKLSGLNAEDFL